MTTQQILAELVESVGERLSPAELTVWRGEVHPASCSRGEPDSEPNAAESRDWPAELYSGAIH